MPLDEKEPLKEGEYVSSEDDFDSEDENWKVTVRLYHFDDFCLCGRVWYNYV